ncbi:MAG: lipoprotein signal peptidase [Bacteroidaceae bacterium]|nr:lipoprotein signal peptidase [Bacteroidaceae bacterium]
MTISTATKKKLAALAVVLLILCIDQWLKVWVKTTLCPGESIRLADWAYIAFVENKGMAFGMQFIGTLMLATFRLVAVGLLAWMLWRITSTNRVKWGFVLLLSMVMAGAMGNIIDNMFYGLIFSDSNGLTPATLVPLGQGYGSLMEGRVVDMFYFPIISTEWPQWVPIVGGDHFTFFSPIFNFADAAITTGGALLVICYYKTLNQLLTRKKTDID